MNLQQLIRELSARGVRLSSENDKLRAHAPKGMLTPELSAAIAANKPALLAYLAQPAAQPKTPIRRADRSRPLPLSAPQRRMWFLDALEGRSATYNIVAALRMQGRLSQPALQAALQGIVERHEALRTRFPAVAGEPTQVIDRPAPLAVQTLDRSALADPWPGLQAVLEQHAAEPFDLAADRLLRALLVKQADDDHVLLLMVHHIVADGWSIGVLVKEFGELYGAACEQRAPQLPELSIQVADIAAWQQEPQNIAAQQAQRDYWLGQLADLPPLLELPTDHPRPPVQRFRGATVTFQIDAELTRHLKTLFQMHDVTLFMGLLAGFAVLLHGLTRRDDIVIGSPVANRPQAEMEPLIGFFVNTLALRLPLADHWTLREVLQAVRQQTLAAFQHQDVPFEELVDLLRTERSLAYAPIFQVMFALQNAPGSGLTLPDLQLSPLAVDTHTAKFDLNVSLFETPDGLQGQIEYATDLFERATMERLAERYQNVLRYFVEPDATRVADIQWLTANEWSSLSTFFPLLDSTPPPFHPLPYYVEAAAQRWPDAIALVAPNEAPLTYDQLNRRANQLANHLLALGVQPDQPVGLCLPRGVDLFVALLGILKAGGAYLPLDPEYPDERLAYMVGDAGCRAVVCAVRRGCFGAVEQVCLDQDLRHQLRHRADDNPALAIGPQHLGYVIYTSGSTGKPKGVAMAQGALCNLLQWQAATLPLAAGTPVLQFASINFDVSFQETLSTWAAGGCLRVADADRRRDADALLAWLIEQQIQRAFLPVVMLHHLAQAVRRSGQLPSALRDVITAGEALTLTDDVRWLFGQMPDCRLHNHYGPSETHVVTAWTLPGNPKDWPAVAAIGRPIDHCSVVIVTPGNQFCPVGVPGELLIGGVGLARGYLRRPELTAERFVPDPLTGNGRLYRSGDLARWRADGALELIGRVDHQVKIRGFRVELGEIEANLAQHPALNNVAVVVRGAGNDKRLVAYYSAQPGQAPTMAALRAHLQASLPPWMIPVQWVELPELPLTLSGKIDRLRLPTMELATISQAAEPPATPLEAALLPLWRDLLAQPELGVTADFFAAGGHSLTAARLANRISQELQRACPLRLLFEHSTVRELAQALEGAQPAADRIPRQARGRLQPCSSQQRRLWFQARLSGAGGDYNMPGAVRLSGELDVTAVRRAFSALVARHEPLRTRLVERDDQPWQEILPPPPLTIDIQPLTAAELPAALAAEAQTPFALDQAPLLRVRLFRLSDSQHVLAFTLHHAIADGWSIGLLTQEFAALYTAAQMQPDAPASDLPATVLAPLSIQYADYAAWQQGQVSNAPQQLARWRALLGDLPPLLPLPTDYPRPALAGSAGGTVPLVVPTPRLAALRRLAEQHHVTLYVLLLAAWQSWLARLTGERHFAIGTAHAHRDRPELEPLIGYFAEVCAVPARLDRLPGYRVAELLAQTRATVLETTQMLDVPFEQVVDAVAPRRAPGHTPIFQCMFLLHNLPDTHAHLDGLTATPLPPTGDSAKHDLSLHIWESADRLTGHFEFRRDLFHPDTITDWRNDFIRWLMRWCNEDNAPIFDEQMPAPRSLRLEDGELEQMVAGLVEDEEAFSGTVFSPRPLAGEGQGERAKRSAENEKSPEPDSLTALTTFLRHSDNPISLDAGSALLAEQHRQPMALTARRVNGATRLLCASVGQAPQLPSLAVRRLPLTAGGRVDDAALAQLPRLNAAWAAQLEQQLSQWPGVSGVAVLALPLAEPPHLHLSDLLPQRPLLAVDSAVAAALAPVATAPANHPQLPPAYADGGPLQLPDDYPATLGAALHRTAERWPQRGIRILAAHGEVFISYAELLQRAQQRLAALQSLGWQPGHYAILQIPDLAEYFPTFWACVLGGIVPVTVAVPAQYSADHAVSKKLLHTWRTLEQPTIIAGDVQAAGLTALDSSLWVLPLAQIQAATQADQRGREHPAQPQDRVFFQLSAGSTGLSKAITETHAGVLRHIHAGALACGVTADDVSVNWLPMDHVVPLLTWHLRDTVLGIPQVEIPTERVLADPLLWLETLHRFRGTLTWAPNFGFRLVADALSRRHERVFDLSSMLWFMNAGEQVTRPVLQAFLAGTAPFGVTASMFQPAFGMAEVCTCMTYNNDYSEQQVHRIRKSSLGATLTDAPPGDLDAVEFVDLGPPVAGVEIRIADSAHQTLPERTIGRLQIRGGVVTPGYYRNDAANAEAFVGDGWFNTGDLGFMAGGRLALTGREKEMIIVHGANFYCHEVEDVVNSVPGVLPTYSAAVGVAEQHAGTEALVVFCVPDDSRPEAELAAAVRDQVTRSLGIAPAYVALLPKAEFPKTTSGKIQRAQLKNSLLAGSFDARLKALDIAARNEHTLPPCWHQRVWRPAQVWPRTTAPTVLLVDDGDSDLARPLAKLLEGWCIGAVASDDAIPDTVTDLVWLNAWRPQIQPLDNELAAAAYAALLQLLARLPQRPLRLTVAVTQLAATDPDLEISSLWGGLPGLLATARQEFPQLTTVLVDLPAASWRNHAEWLASELLCHAGERHVAWRLPMAAGDEDLAGPALRLVERLQAITPTPTQPLPFQTGGRYLLTGGLGGIGQVLAGWLLEHYRADLLLVLRQEPTFHPAWHDLEQTARRCGGSVAFVVADLADGGAVQSALPDALQRFACDGAIHLAGYYAEQALSATQAADLHHAAAAKVMGLWLLDQLLPPKVWLLAFSSVLGWFGARQAGCYAAANSWLDHVAADLRRRRVIHAPAFSNWRNLGMSADYPAQAASEARGYRFLDADAGLNALLATLAAGWPAPLIGLDDQRPDVALTLDSGPLATERWTAFVEAPQPPTLPPITDADHQPLLLDWQYLPQLPRSADGAIDRAALLARAGRQVGSAPASPLEQQLADIWTDVLGHAPPGRKARFFEHGGNSIAAVAFVARIARSLGREVPVATLFRAQTLAELAAELAVEATSAPMSDCLVELQPGTAEPTVVLCHPGGGNLLCYRDLAAALAPRRVLGVQAPAWNGGALPANWQDLIDHYAAALTADIPPGGALILAGWSFGGLVAFGLACRLQSSHPVRLCILDVTADLNDAERDLAEQAEAFDTVFEAFPELQPQRATIAALPAAQQLPAVLDQLHATGQLPSGFDLPQATRFLAMTQRFVELRLQGLPENWHYHGAGTVLCSKETRQRGYAENLDWGARISHIAAYEVMDRHLDFVLPQFVGDLAAMIVE